MQSWRIAELYRILRTERARPRCTKPRSMVTRTSSSIYCQTRRTSTHRMRMAGPRCIMHVLRYAISHLRSLLPDRSQGYLDIVRWLCESGGAAEAVDGVRGVDMRSKGGWTPLMNAASKGHLPVVLYLLTKQNADPFVRNNWGETAYDAAAAVFEVWICEVLQKAEIENWRNKHVAYNPISVHTTVPLVLYENQRLDVRLKTLAVSGGRPRFSASGLGRHGRRAPFELRLPMSEQSTGKKEIGAWRSDVQLPLREDPWTLPRPGSSREGTERSHFWLSDWTLDVTHPGVDAEDGWQYAHSFDAPEDEWTAEQPPQLGRLLNGTGAMSAGFGGSRSRGASGASSSSRSGGNSAGSQSWVRRRRWVRVMRRRLDIPPLPFLQPDGQLYHLAADGTLIPYVENDDDNFSEADGQELSAMPSSGLAGQDYVAHARYLADTQYNDSDSTNGERSPLEARRTIAKLERATSELRQGILGDTDVERKTQAEGLRACFCLEMMTKSMKTTIQTRNSITPAQNLSVRREPRRYVLPPLATSVGQALGGPQTSRPIWRKLPTSVYLRMRLLKRS
ncbi:hypothetical protein DAEQUDRAFT_487317 [Daedalea quercina L-15889]|uniref:Uncharacterized protein n=1 Tax=Daedalea quercina L-15889 TaxID=1314783 RepID=A0A165MQV0_9APHY|nr:hypothetical protein DAEQUDRAFT_487317 [Daedalea quercina L-15889]